MGKEEDDDFVRRKYHIKDSSLLKESFIPLIARPDIDYQKFWVERDNFSNRVKTIIDESLNIKNNYLKFIVGSYGRGKTFSLYKIKYLCQEYDDIYCINFTFLGEDNVKVIDFLYKIFKEFDFEYIVDKKSIADIRNAIKKIPAKYDEPIRFLYGLYNITPNTEEQINPITHLSINRDYRFFLTNQISPPKKSGILRKINSTDIAKEYLYALLIFLKELGYSSLVILVDEFEYLYSLVSKNERNKFIVLLRSLYDTTITKDSYSVPISNLLLFIATTDTAYSDLTVTKFSSGEIESPLTPLMQRAGNPIILDTLTRNEVEKLIEIRLSINRYGELESSPLIPFTEDFVDYVYSMTYGEPRDAVDICGNVLSAAIREKIELIDKKFAKSIEQKEPSY